MNLRTGVISINSLDEYFFDQESIDLSFYQHEKECPKKYHDDCDYNENSEELFGSWKENDDGQLEPDELGEYAAIYNPDFLTLQVVWSKHFSLCNLCSPCFPNQGDLDSVGQYEAYNLPPVELSERYLKQHKVFNVISD